MGARLGQHFLRDAAAARAAAEACGAGPGTRVLEVGPGKGALTRELLALGAEVLAVEKDERLAAELPAALGAGARLKVVAADFLRFDPGSLGEGWLVAGNLPYAVASPILRRILDWRGWSRAALMFQREVAERVCAGPGGPDYGLLSLAAALRASASVALTLAPEAFRPRPRVESAVVVLERRGRPLLEAAEEAAFWRLARAAFSQRRKTAAKSLAAAAGREKSEAEAALARLGLRPDARPQDIPVSAWIELARLWA